MEEKCDEKGVSNVVPGGLHGPGSGSDVLKGSECRDSSAFYFSGGKVKLWSGDFKQSPATLIRVAFDFSNLYLRKKNS